MSKLELTLLTKDQLWGKEQLSKYNRENLVKSVENYKSRLAKGKLWRKAEEKQLKVFKKYGTKAAISDLVILTGGRYKSRENYTIPDDDSAKGKTGCFYTKSTDHQEEVCMADYMGEQFHDFCQTHCGAIRPVLQSPDIFRQVYGRRKSGYHGIKEVEYGEYPQYAPNCNTQQALEREYLVEHLKTTSRSYTFDVSNYHHDVYFTHRELEPIVYKEYEYQGKKYIRIEANTWNFPGDVFQLSNGEYYQNGDYVWLEVSPVKWLVDRKTKMLISKIGLLSGIKFCHDRSTYLGEDDFQKTEVKEYLDKYMVKDLFQSGMLVKTENMFSQVNKIVKHKNEKKPEKIDRREEKSAHQQKREEQKKALLDLKEVLSQQAIKPSDKTASDTLDVIDIKGTKRSH